MIDVMAVTIIYCCRKRVRHIQSTDGQTVRQAGRQTDRQTVSV